MRTAPRLGFALPFSRIGLDSIDAIAIGCESSIVPLKFAFGRQGFKATDHERSPRFRVRFSLIDRITELEPGVRIQAVKNVTLAEEYLQDHFPGFPILPGVFLVEALVQSGAWLMRHTENFRYAYILMKEAKAVRFNNFVAPGKTLHVACEVTKRDERTYTFKGSGTVDGQSAISAKITLEQMNLAEKNPSLARSDERCLEKMRELFGSLWSEPATA